MKSGCRITKQTNSLSTNFSCKRVYRKPPHHHISQKCSRATFCRVHVLLSFPISVDHSYSRHIQRFGIKKKKRKKKTSDAKILSKMKNYALQQESVLGCPWQSFFSLFLNIKRSTHTGATCLHIVCENRFAITARQRRRCVHPSPPLKRQQLFQALRFLSAPCGVTQCVLR